MNVTFVAKRGFTIPDADLEQLKEIKSEAWPLKGDRIALQTEDLVTALYEVADRDFIINRPLHGCAPTELVFVLRPLVLPHSPKSQSSPA